MENWLNLAKGVKLGNIKNYYDGIKNTVLQRSPLEVKVRNATSNDPWGAKTSEKKEIAEATFNFEDRKTIMKVIWERLGENGKNWRNVLKALQLLEFLIVNGSSTCAEEAKDNIYTVRTLRNFRFVDEQGREQGKGVRDLAKKLSKLLHEQDEIKKLRNQAKKQQNKYTGFSREDARYNTKSKTYDSDEKKSSDNESDEEEIEKKPKKDFVPEEESDEEENFEEKEIPKKKNISEKKESIIVVKRPRAPSFEKKNEENVETNKSQQHGAIFDIDSFFENTPNINQNKNQNINKKKIEEKKK